jgi:HNH endonuclease
VDRYSGLRLVFPGSLRILSLRLPNAFPYHKNGKTDECHFAFWELFPTIDHVIPVSRGGKDDETNWVTTSMAKNAAKANFTMEEIDWKLLPRGDVKEWDGQLAWFLAEVERDPALLDVPYIRDWKWAVDALNRSTV